MVTIPATISYDFGALSLSGDPLATAPPLCPSPFRVSRHRSTFLPFTTRLFSRSPHQCHSKRFNRPLFSYSYALFCIAKMPISHLFKVFRTLCTKHRGWRTPYLKKEHLHPVVSGLQPPRNLNLLIPQAPQLAVPIAPPQAVNAVNSRPIRIPGSAPITSTCRNKRKPKISPTISLPDPRIFKPPRASTSPSPTSIAFSPPIGSPPAAPRSSPMSTASFSAPFPPLTTTTALATPIPLPQKTTNQNQTLPKQTPNKPAQPQRRHPIRLRTPPPSGIHPSPNPIPQRSPHDRHQPQASIDRACAAHDAPRLDVYVQMY